MDRDRSPRSTTDAKPGLGGKDNQNTYSKPPISSSGNNRGIEQGTQQFRAEYLVDSPYETQQPRSNGSPISRDAECRDDPGKSISSLLFTKNTNDAGGGPSFCTNLWPPPNPGGTTTDSPIFDHPTT
ncbi:hypothetical protein FXO38_13275 [Capsicum annuum]|nr:hypothetical protein FXO38_13275 [Capsicum annuum]